MADMYLYPLVFFFQPLSKIKNEIQGNETAIMSYLKKQKKTKYEIISEHKDTLANQKLEDRQWSWASSEKLQL